MRSDLSENSRFDLTLYQLSPSEASKNHKKPLPKVSPRKLDSKVPPGAPREVPKGPQEGIQGPPGAPQGSLFPPKLASRLGTVQFI